MQPAPSRKLIRSADMCEMLGIATTTLWRWAKELPGFPKPVRIGPRVCAWRAEEVEDWLAARPDIYGGKSPAA